VVAPAGVTLYDDATVPGGRGTAPYDDEGKPAGRALLIEGGVLRGFLVDRLHAVRYGWPAAGAARRQDYRFSPLPRMTNLILEPGAVPPEDLIAGVPDGLYVRQVGHGVYDPAAGRYAFEVRDGQRIEQGRLTHPVAGVRIVGAAANALDGIAGIGNDFRVDTARGLCRKGEQVVPVSVGMPSVLIRAMTVEPAPSPS
jgi:TldD protein